jgi:hypothetical protein
MNDPMTEKSRKARRTRAGMRYWWKPGHLYDNSTRWYSQIGQLGNVAHGIRGKEHSLTATYVPHQRLGPPGVRIWNCAAAELTRVLITAKEASRELNIFHVLKEEGGGGG